MPEAHSIGTDLQAARLLYWEQPAAAFDVAVRCQEHARRLGLDALYARALTLEGAVSLHRGDLQGAFALVASAEALIGDDAHAGTELAALNTHLHFFSGSYADSLRWAHKAVALADSTDDASLRLHARRMACLAFGNVGVDDLRERFEEVLALARAGQSPWEEAVARNDIAHRCMVDGDLDAADAQLAAGLQLADECEPSSFLRGLIHATRSELRLAAGRAEDALQEAQHATRLIAAPARDANPYLLGMAVVGQVQALLALDRVEDARAAGEEAVERLGDRVPQARSMILSEVAAALRRAGRLEEAYDTLVRCAELERQALREFSQLLLGLERARAEAAQLREEADQDWLTGLGNRRLFARVRSDLTAAQPAADLSLAVVDLDHFKAINDVFGHAVGDAVLVRIASLLSTHVRSEDNVVRMGGEEFAVLMPGAGPEEAAGCSERLRRVIADAAWNDVAAGLSVSASIGVASTSECADAADLERLADERLYAAKAAGRDRVVHGH